MMRCDFVCKMKKEMEVIMKRKWLATVLALAMMGSLLAGCGDGNSASTSEGADSTSGSASQSGNSNGEVQYLVWNIGAEPKPGIQPSVQKPFPKILQSACLRG